jgi:hypothetical protein
MPGGCADYAEALILVGDMDQARRLVHGLLAAGTFDPVVLHAMRLCLGEPVATVGPELRAAWAALEPGYSPTWSWRRVKPWAIKRGRPDLAALLDVLERPPSPDATAELNRRLASLQDVPAP